MLNETCECGVKDCTEWPNCLDEERAAELVQQIIAEEMGNKLPPREWYTYHGNVVAMCRRMAECGYSAEAIAYAVEKPWKYADVFASALRERDRENG